MEIISFTRLETAKFPCCWHSGEHLKRYMELKGMDSAIMNIENLQRCVGVVEGVCMLFVCVSLGIIFDIPSILHADFRRFGSIPDPFSHEHMHTHTHTHTRVHTHITHTSERTHTHPPTRTHNQSPTHTHTRAFTSNTRPHARVIASPSQVNLPEPSTANATPWVIRAHELIQDLNKPSTARLHVDLGSVGEDAS